MMARPEPYFSGLHDYHAVSGSGVYGDMIAPQFDWGQTAILPMGAIRP